ncbi:MAG: hypothetical protein IJZ06_08205 [Bacteroidales bacterium]|nr:hypothetical protein [Bacteroidales bacterium]
MKTIKFTFEPSYHGLLQNSLQNPVMEQEKDYIEKQEILDAIRAGLLEIKEARLKGRELMDAEDLLNELSSNYLR